MLWIWLDSSERILIRHCKHLIRHILVTVSKQHKAAFVVLVYIPINFLHLCIHQCEVEFRSSIME